MYIYFKGLEFAFKIIPDHLFCHNFYSYLHNNSPWRYFLMNAMVHQSIDLLISTCKKTEFNDHSVRGIIIYT
jgi:hypothetical protein